MVMGLSKSQNGHMLKIAYARFFKRLNGKNDKRLKGNFKKAQRERKKKIKVFQRFELKNSSNL